jgi:phosphatidylserine/phosphatidylglycerophosphate/cardiolipin synthase-like enzyme
VTSVVRTLSRANLVALGEALSHGRLSPPFTGVSLRRLISPPLVDGLASELQQLVGEGMRAAHIGWMLLQLAEEREAVQDTADRIELVWTGPEVGPVASRDTAVVVRELFNRAKHSVLVAGFAVYKGRKVFDRLAANMAHNPDLKARMFLNVTRSHDDTRTEAEIVEEFRHRFIANHWTDVRIPDLYYDPRALSVEATPKAVLHAKCIVIDERWSFVTSANFTEAAQERNIEVGLLVEDTSLAKALTLQFTGLVRAGALTRMVGIA